jgi:hypothetical protein
MLLGLAGQIGAGKDAVYERAGVLAPELGITSVERVSFADKLKLAAARAIGVSVETLEGLKRNERARVELTVWNETDPATHPVSGINAITVRKYLQLFGTEVGRETFGDSFWVDQALPSDLNHTGRLICVTDVRFPNEAARVLELGGIVVRVLNGPLLEPEHASEQILEDEFISFTFDNSVRNDDFANLDEQLRDTLEMLVGGEAFVA